MLMAVKTSPIFWLSSPLHHNNQNLIHEKPPNSSLFLKPISKGFSSSSTSTHCSTTCASASLTKSNNNVKIDVNTEIFNFCEMGNLKKAVELLCSSEKSDLDLKTYCSVLQLCAIQRSLQDGKRVHSIIDSNGILVDGILGAKLVFMYVNCSDLKNGRRIFDKVLNNKVYLWNLMISEYAKIGKFEESISLFKKMLILEIDPNSYTFSSILKCFASVGSVEEGRQVHCRLYRLGFDSFNTVVNSLIAFYFKCRKIENARKVFDELPDRDVISWNTVISGYIANGLSEKAIEIYINMLYAEIDVDLATMVNVLVGCANMGVLPFGKTVHGYALKSCIDDEIKFANTLLDMYAKCGDLSDAIKVFDKMEERSVVTWTSMIASYVREGQSNGAIRLFHKMKSDGVMPDVFTITSIIHACANNECLDNGKSIHDYVRENRLESNLFVCNALMDMYAKCGSMEDAHGVFDKMTFRDIISWNTMIGGYSKNSLPNEALNLFLQMQRGLKPNSITMACVLPTCASLAALDKGREIHGYILKNRNCLDKYVVNALVDMYVKCGALVIARSLFDMIARKDLVSWTVMIAGYGMHGFGNEAINAFNEMRLSSIQPDEVSFISILYACSHSGLVDEGWKFFNIMKNEDNIEPKLEHYACMVDLLARTGKLSKAYRFIEQMPIKPDATIWGALLCGCRIHHDVKLAEKVAEHVFELEPENTGYYVLLANIYAEAEKWEEVKKMRLKISRRGLKKNPGCSWIEFKGEVNIFVAGDRSHPQAKKIDLVLKKMRARMKEEGYGSKTKYALISGDEMEKEVALCGHSEKLAMAFGILSLPPGKTIRVTKNLRVCGDCHEMAKFMSKATMREIVLRDSNRFHHFKDGSCSCRGFW